MKIEEIGEINLIKHLTTNLTQEYDSSVKLGVGDDAAAIKLSDDHYLLLTVDMLVEGRHFLIDKIQPEQLGHKSLAASLSDIAAMGGSPRYALISVGWPAYVDLNYTERVYAGLRELAHEFGVNIIGGDTVKAPQLVVDVTLLGEIKKEPIARSGAQPGELIAVTGRVGASAAGLNLLVNEQNKEKLSSKTIDELLQAHLAPVPRVKEALLLVKNDIPTAMIDVSDGVVSEVNHICSSSGVGGIIYAENLPVDINTIEAAACLEEDHLDWALYGGEDYELIFTLPESKVSQARKVLSETGTELHIIGKTLSSESGLHLEKEGEVVPLSVKGYDHFHE